MYIGDTKKKLSPIVLKTNCRFYLTDIILNEMNEDIDICYNDYCINEQMFCCLTQFAQNHILTWNRSWTYRVTYFIYSVDRILFKNKCVQ